MQAEGLHARHSKEMGERVLPDIQPIITVQKPSGHFDKSYNSFHHRLGCGLD
jgi:hypothetical protein